MKRDEFIARFPHASESTIRKNCPDDKGAGKRTASKEFEVNLPQPQNRKAVRRHKANDKGMDAVSHPKFAISIDLLISDCKCRDADNCLSGLLDCLVAALNGIRRLD